MEEKIKAALRGLSVRENDHWTSEGLPQLKALGIEGVKRADVTAVAPHFTRDNPVIDTPAAAEEKSREQEIAEAEAKQKAEATTIEDQKAQLELVIQTKAKAVQEAMKEHKEAVEALDVLLLKEHRAGVARKPIHDIMDFVKSQRDQREAKAKALRGE